MPWILTEIRLAKGGSRKWARTMLTSCQRCGTEKRRPYDDRLDHNRLFCSKKCANVDSTSARATPVGADGSKVCKDCCERKPATDFFAHGPRLGTYCKVCFARRNKPNLAISDRRRYEALLASGTCVACRTSPATDGTTKCAECRQRNAVKHIKHRADHREMGLCYLCSANPSDAGSVCSECWFRRVAGQTLHDATAAPAIKELWEAQMGMCALTGVRLVPGAKRVSLDHIVPQARGGGHEISNLRWITMNVNRAKSSLLDDEFIEMCRQVVAVAAARSH